LENSRGLAPEGFAFADSLSRYTVGTRCPSRLIIVSYGAQPADYQLILAVGRENHKEKLTWQDLGRATRGAPETQALRLCFVISQRPWPSSQPAPILCTCDLTRSCSYGLILLASVIPRSQSPAWEVEQPLCCFESRSASAGSCQKRPRCIARETGRGSCPDSGKSHTRAPYERANSLRPEPVASSPSSAIAEGVESCERHSLSGSFCCLA